MMPLGAPSISQYGSLVRPDAQIVALRTHRAKCAPQKGFYKRWDIQYHALGYAANDPPKGGGLRRTCLRLI